MQPTDLASRIRDWIRERVEAAGARGVVVGMSGGLDSSIVAVLCKQAFPDTTLGLILPCFSRNEDVTHAKLVAARFGIEAREFDLSPIFTILLDLLEEGEEEARESELNMAIANLKPRLRMICLYYFANQLNYLVVGTGNKSELSIGYFTKYGDGAADILPLGDLLKTEERELAVALGIPEEIIEKAPSAGLWAGQTDEAEIGMSYADLDRALTALKLEDLESTSGYESEVMERVKRMTGASRHKREPIPIFKRSSR